LLAVNQGGIKEKGIEDDTPGAIYNCAFVLAGGHKAWKGCPTKIQSKTGKGIRYNWEESYVPERRRGNVILGTFPQCYIVRGGIFSREK